MTRQSVTQHLGVLEDANLVSTVRRGREKLHYLNPVPLHEIQERWIEKFERPRLRALSERETTSRGHHDRQADLRLRHLHRGQRRAVWQALTDADLTAAYWGHRNVSDWQAGSTWDHVRIDGSGTRRRRHREEADPPRRLVTDLGRRTEQPGGTSRVTFDDRALRTASSG